MEKCTTNRLPSSQQHLAMYLLADVWKLQEEGQETLSVQVGMMK